MLRTGSDGCIVNLRRCSNVSHRAFGAHLIRDPRQDLRADVEKYQDSKSRTRHSCMTVAIRPLNVKELAEALVVDFDAAQQGGIPKLNPNWR